MKNGLLPIKYKDHRTYDFHQTFGTVTGTFADFNFDTSNLFPDQNKDGFPNACTAYTENDIASNDDKLGYFDDQPFTYSNTKLIAGLKGDVPVDHLTALKSGTVYGVKKKAETSDQALIHRRSPYFIVKKNLDFFDGLLSAMMIKQGGLSIGTPWLPVFETIGNDGVIPDFQAPKDFLTGHCWEACGQKTINGEPRIICKSWQGPDYGDKGYCYFNRKQINDLLSVKGAGAFGQKHASPEDIQRVKITIIEVIISYFWQILAKFTLPKPTPLPNPPVIAPQPQPQPVKLPDPPKYLWDNLPNIRHSIRVIGDEYFLSVIQKDLLCDICSCESEFKVNARLVNSPTSIDRGLFQWNTKYHPEITDEIAYNPEKATRLACQAIKSGKNYWTASQPCWNKTGRYDFFARRTL